SSVSIDENRIAVGDFGCSLAGTNSGCIYLYAWDGQQWEGTRLSAEHLRQGDRFGAAVSISGGNVVVGAYSGDCNGQGSGCAYAFMEDQPGAASFISPVEDMK